MRSTASRCRTTTRWRRTGCSDLWRARSSSRSFATSPKSPSVATDGRHVNAQHAYKSSSAMVDGWRKGALERNSTHGGPGIGDPDWVVARRGLVGMEGDGGGRRLAVHEPSMTDPSADSCLIHNHINQLPCLLVRSQPALQQMSFVVPPRPMSTRPKVSLVPPSRLHRGTHATRDGPLGEPGPDGGDGGGGTASRLCLLAQSFACTQSMNAC